MKNVNFYQLIGICAIVVIAWFVQLIGLSYFRTALITGPPKINIVDPETFYSDKNKDKLITEMGYDINASFCSAKVAQEQIATYQRNKWIYFLIGVLGSICTFLMSYKLSGNWLFAIICILFGPTVTAIFIQKYFRNN